MFKFLLLFYSLMAVQLFAATSEIPLKREFPVNEKINPCENLYEHACSKTIESFKLREDRRRHAFAFSDSAERILEFKKRTIKELARSVADSPTIAQLKNYYLACMDKDARAKEETDFIQKLLEKQSKIKTTSEWLNLQAKRIHSGDSGFIGYYGADNFDDARKTDLMIAAGYSILPEKSYAKNEVLVKELEILITNFFKTIKVDNPEARAKTVIKYELEYQENRFFPVEARIAYSQRRFTNKKELLSKFPALELKVFLDEVPNKTLIRILNPKTIPYLNKVATTYSLDELKTLELFYELSSRLDMGYPKFYEETFAFRNKFLGGKSKRSELDEECTTFVMERFGPEFDYIVLPKMFPNFSSDKVALLVEKIRASILTSLSGNTWLSPTAKKEAQRKISTAFMRLVAPQKYEDWKFLPIADYSDKTYLANNILRSGIVDTREFKYFSELKDIRSWEGVEPLTVNAFYQASYNQFTMMQGILQYPFYDQASSEVENLAGVGMVVGHELGHGIDDQGSKYNADGRLHEWMKPADIKKFKELTKTLIEQYNKAGMNGEYTLGENIGDLVGLTAAYDAAFSKETIPNEELKKQQKIFFLNYTRSWCEVQLPGVRELRLKSDPHSLGKARVNEIVKHFVGFQQAFDCKATDPMVLPADKKVHIW
ncbi:MAG: M13 family metallopeptidase [Bacteriovorax sp.]|jgi:putative endopeptidase